MYNGVKIFTKLHSNFEKTNIFRDIKLVHVVQDFRPWDVMTKVHYFLMVQIDNLRTLEVEHDLETC